MRISKAARREAKQLFRSCFVAGVLDDDRVRQVIQQVIQARPRGFMAILSHFQRLAKLDVDRRTARIESASPLQPDLKTRLQGDLEKRYGPGLIVSFAENPELLGGLRVKVGSNVFDGSVRARLEALQEKF